MRFKNRRAFVAAGAAGVLAAAVLYREAAGRFVPAAAQAPAGADARPGDSRAGGPSASRQSPVAEVDLGALELPRPKPVEGERDPFRFRPRQPAAPPPAAARAGGSPQDPSAAQVPAGPSPPPAIALKFIGIVDAPAGAGRLAVLSDGRSVYHGREGETIEGRFRILRIGAESVELAYTDGRGRQTIRLTGQ